MLFNDCLPYLIYNFRSEHDLLLAIEELSEKFTVKRENIQDYLKDPRLASAYTAFYLTTNIPKWRAVLEWMPREWLELIKKARFVDVGAGPGTYSLAFREWAATSFTSAYQIETSPVMREQAQKLWMGLYPNVAMEQLSSLREMKGSFMVFGHSANEMGPEKVLTYIEKVNPDHLLFIEPGTKSFFPQMLKIREALIEKKYNVIFPCPTHETCPMAHQDQDWCHQFIHVKQSPEVERLSQMLHMDRRHLPLTVHAYSRTYQHSDSERVVRVHPSTKFSFEWDVCLGEKIEHYQVMKRNFDKKTLKALDEVLSGAAILTEVEKTMENTKRVKLLKINNILS